MSQVYPLGRLYVPDVRDNQFKMASLLPPKSQTVPTSKTWVTGPILDQGNKPHCVGFAWRQFLYSSPLRTKVGPTGAEIYSLAQTMDAWPGENYDGTSVRGGAKALQSLNRLASYYWANSTNDIKQFVLSTGTVVVGTNWYSDMFTPKSNGFVSLTGDNVGGHAWLIAGYNTKKKAFRAVNSWGREWGQAGRFWIAEDDMARLLSEYGEACTAVEKSA